MENNNKSNNNFFGGFLLGFLFGGIVIFLLATKKGKKILKAISEEGTDKIADIIEKMDKTENVEEFEEEDEEVVMPKRQIVVREVREKPKTRRFFRGVSKHSN